MIVLPLRFRVILIVALCLGAFAVWKMNQDSKPKEQYEKLSGTITYIDKRLGALPNRDLGKYRYLKIDNYKYPLEIFIGKDAGDFKPKFEKIDSLKVGDAISIYHYSSDDTQNQGINRVIQFIEKNNVLYFERGDASKIIGISILALSIGLIIISLIALKMKKIKY